ncbi:hypothetical protein BU17DRAFT_67324 [Hysterangium stoloniferum]|nr:hypothetical protein BU17DRAFT_67324 [Hysterangium stoloniferum]
MKSTLDFPNRPQTDSRTGFCDMMIINPRSPHKLKGLAEPLTIHFKEDGQWEMAEVLTVRCYLSSSSDNILLSERMRKQPRYLHNIFSMKDDHWRHAWEKQLTSLSEEEIITYATETIHPFKCCKGLELPDKIYCHVIEEHGDSDTVLSPQAFPSEPTIVPGPLPHLTNESKLKYTIIPLVKPSSRVKNPKVTSRQAKPHHTPWSYFECHEQTEEKATKPHDLDFEPLQRPYTSSVLAVWPKFSVCTIPTPAYRVQVSAPPISHAKRPPDLDAPLQPTYLYEAFRKYVSEKKDRDIVMLPE